MAVKIPVRHRERVVLALIAAVVLGLGVVVARHLRQASENATVLYGRLADGLDLIDDLQFNIQETRRTLLYALHTSDANRQLAYAEQSRAAETNVDTRLSDRSALTSAPAAATQQDLVVSDSVQAGVMAVMAIADTAKVDILRQQKRRY